MYINRMCIYPKLVNKEIKYNGCSLFLGEDLPRDVCFACPHCEEDKLPLCNLNSKNNRNSIDVLVDGEQLFVSCPLQVKYILEKLEKKLEKV